MDVILIIASFVMMGSLVYLLIKGYNPVLCLMLLGFVAIVIMQYVNRASIIGEATSGNYLLDVFTHLRNVFISQFTSVGINVMVVLGYVKLLDHIKANDLFAVLLGSTVKNLKSKYVILTITLLIGVIVKWIIPSAITTFLLLLATVYPVLRALGISKLTAISALTVTTTWPLGPNQFFTGMIFGTFTDVEFTAPEFFLQQELLFIGPTLVITVIAFILSTKYFEKKEKAAGLAEDESEIAIEKLIPESFGIPMFYASLPIIPLVIVLLFSGTIIPGLRIDVVPAYLMCLLFVVFVNFVRNKSLKIAGDDLAIFFKGMGDSFGNFVCLVIAGAFFADGFAQVGGMAIMMNMLIAPGASAIPMLIIGCVASFVVGALSGNIAVGFFSVGALFGTFITATGADPFFMFAPFVTVSAAGTMLSVASISVLVPAKEAGVPPTRLIKRNAVPTVFAAATVLICSILMFY